MNKKAQKEIGVGVLMTIFISVLVGIILFISVAQSVGETLDTSSYDSATEGSITCPASGSYLDLDGQDLLSTPTVTNLSGDTIPATNYTIAEGVSTSTGVKSIRYLANDAIYDGLALNVSYDYGADGYIENSGSRVMVGLITIFFALAIAFIALEPTLRSGVIDKMGI